MIAHLKGIVLTKQSDRVIVDVQGVGYTVAVASNTFLELPPEGLPVSLFIYTHVREDQLTLFGFLSMKEKHLFEALITVNGVGPKLALTLLSGAAAGEIIEAIVTENIAFLKASPGIGQKVAERLVMELKGKLHWEPQNASKTKSGRKGGVETFDQALSALTNLGYTVAQAEQALRRLDWTAEIQIHDAIKEGLRQLARG